MTESSSTPPELSVVIPCFNAAGTLEVCVRRVLEIAGEVDGLEIVIVDDAAPGGGVRPAESLAVLHPEVTLRRHNRNAGRGAALRTGFTAARGAYVVVQDADLDDDPCDLLRLIGPLRTGEADVVLGSRFAARDRRQGPRFWHGLAHRGLTLLSNMVANLDITDLNCRHKAYRREVVKAIEICEDGFGADAEIVTKAAARRDRILEVPLAHRPCARAMGGKIGLKGGLQTLFSIVRHGGKTAPTAVQFFLYLFIGGAAAVCNLAFFLALNTFLPPVAAALLAFYGAAIVNYRLCVRYLFEQNALWSTPAELAVYLSVIGCVALMDAGVTHFLIEDGIAPWLAKCAAISIGLLLNFAARKYVVFYKRPLGDTK